MARYIDADKVLLELQKFSLDTSNSYGVGYSDCLTAVEDVLNEAPTADVVEVKHGYNATYINPVDEFVCSVCSFKCTDYTEIVTEENDDIWYRECEFDYCPRCGAKMDGGKEE